MTTLVIITIIAGVLANVFIFGILIISKCSDEKMDEIMRPERHRYDKQIEG